MNYDAFSHGQIASKLWLCEKLEPYLSHTDNLVILGSWYNVLGFMLQVRNPGKCESIQGIDIDFAAVEIARKICDAWPEITNTRADANTGPPYEAEVVINCSPEHMSGSQWFAKIKPGTVVCIQSSNMTDPCEPWLIKTPHPTLDDFKSRYPLTTVKYCDAMRVQYNAWGYDRYMIIGVK